MNHYIIKICFSLEEIYTNFDEGDVKWEMDINDIYFYTKNKNKN